MIYGYVRVSTDDQDTQNQKFEIETFCKKNKIKINAWCEEKISGTKNFKKGKFGDFIKKSKKGDLIICSEISRLSRDMLILMKILEHCLTNDIQIWTIKDNFRLENNLQSKVLAFAFGMAAEIERTLIAQRTKEALKLRKARGMKLGRQAGSKNKAQMTGEVINCSQCGKEFYTTHRKFCSKECASEHRSENYINKKYGTKRR